MKRKITKEMALLTLLIFIPTLWVPIIDGGEKMDWIPVWAAYPFLVLFHLHKGIDIFIICLIVITGHVSGSLLTAWGIIKIKNKYKKTKLNF